MNTVRQQQLRDAKRKQRERDRAAGLVLYQAKLEAWMADRLKAGFKKPGFKDAFARFLQHELVEVNNYPQLKLLCWNLKTDYLTREEAFSIYERNWRLVDEGSLNPDELELINTLTEEFGGGLLNA